MNPMEEPMTPTTTPVTEGTDQMVTTDGAASQGVEATDVLITSDLLVEDVSIDGMCGVY